MPFEASKRMLAFVDIIPILDLRIIVVYAIW